ncbi:MAG: hypothetical protein UH824_00690, partial [Acutalibacteraceae bacterium]|nr:hypothetical protein [Acutalibacteraceae bacterium]
MSEKIKVAVIAGTPVDTQMGVEFISKNAPQFEPISCPVSDTPQQQTLFQIMPESQKERRIAEIITIAKRVGAKALFVYCNSLSGSVDFEKLSLIHNIKAVTPLNVYTQLAEKHSRIGVIAANNQSLAGIEQAAMLGNPNVEVIGVSLLPVVKLIEQKISPEKITNEWRLYDIMSFFKSCGAEVAVLGCTHFPWIENELIAHSELPIINPADYMLNELSQ